MEQLQHLLHGQGGPPPDTTVMDTAETVYISSLALLKMLKHGTFSRQLVQSCAAQQLAMGVAAPCSLLYVRFCIDHSSLWHCTPVNAAGVVHSLRR